MLGIELVETFFFSPLAHDPRFSHPHTILLKNAFPLLLFTVVGVLVVRVPIEVHLIPLLGITGPSSRHLTPLQTAVAPPTAGAERDEPLDDRIHQVHDYSNNRVGDDQAVAGVCQLQSQAAVDNAQDQPDASPPDMSVAEDAAGARLCELRVVDEAESRLDGEHAHHDSAELDV